MGGDHVRCELGAERSVQALTSGAGWGAPDLRNLPYQPLLLSLLAALGAAGCEDEHEADVSYIPGEVQPFGQAQQEMPDFPRLPRDDLRLEAFNPCCGNRFQITDGPKLSKNAEGKDICVYRIEYTDGDGSCSVGRPLLQQGGAVLAPLVVTRGWG